MNILLIYDKESNSPILDDIKYKIVDLVESKGYKIEKLGLNRIDFKYCIGCFKCWIEDLEGCFMNDMAKVTREKFSNNNTIIYLSPILFGQFSSTIKNVLDKGRPIDYLMKNLQIIIGYGNNINEEEKSTFIDIISRYKKKEQIEGFITQTFEENDAICDKLKEII